MQADLLAVMGGAVTSEADASADDPFASMQAELAAAGLAVAAGEQCACKGEGVGVALPCDATKGGWRNPL